MDWRDNCAVVIPCLNEQKAIGPLVSAVRERLPNVIVVDDGSMDGTAARAREAGAKVIRHEQPRGKGAAINAGLQSAVARDFAWALIMDGDGQHSPEDVPAFLNAADDGQVDLVLGNRMSDAIGMPWLRRQVNRWMSRRLSRAAGVALPDSQCGFRLVRLAAWSAVSIQTEHFEMESELLLEFVARKFVIRSVPIRVIYENERSKIRPLRDTWRWFRWWLGARKRLNQVGAA